MKKFLSSVLLILLVFISLSCTNKAEPYKHYETRLYSLSNSHIASNLYKNIDGDICKFPFLAGGLYLSYNKTDFLTLDFQKRREDVGDYPIHNIKKIYDDQDYIYTVTKNCIRKISKENPFDIEDVLNFNPDKLNIVIDSNVIDFTYSESYVQNALSLQDKKINKKYHVEYSTPVVDGILRIGLYDKKFYFGQTLYSYFYLNLETNELVFFKDENEYELWCKKNINHSVEILEAVFLYE